MMVQSKGVIIMKYPTENQAFIVVNLCFYKTLQGMFFIVPLNTVKHRFTSSNLHQLTKNQRCYFPIPASLLTKLT